MLIHGRIKTSKKAMTKKEIKKAQQNLEKWRKSHKDVYALRNAYRENIPEQVRASMAFEGEHVSIKMLKEYLKRAIDSKGGK